MVHQAAAATTGPPGEKKSGSGPREPGDELARRTFARQVGVGAPANLLGVVVVFAFLGLVFPTTLEPEQSQRLLLRTAALGAGYLAVAFPLGTWLRRRSFEQVARWLREERAASVAERRAVLRQPLDFVIYSAPFWLLAAVLFGLVVATESVAVGVRSGVTIILGGMSTCAFGYLLSERAMRPITARALAAGPPERPLTPGVSIRLVMAWILATGVPLLGMLAIAASYLAGNSVDAQRAFLAMLFLAVLALAVGLSAIFVAARSVADPIAAMRGALAQVEAGDFDARVAVDDGSEVGLLQAGFNGMATGLAERERIRKAFGTYVDREVAEHILREGTDLAGEEVEVTMMFIDIRNFTGFAERVSAPEVVATINRMFARAVPIIHAHHGHVDKFVGDGLLAVFGAPRRQADHADRALAAALQIERAIEDEFAGELSIGVGLNSGAVVAGNVGGAGRLEFSVIGDAVNVAARVEAATRKTGDTILIAQRTKELLHDSDIPLVVRPNLVLKGKRDAATLYAPATEHEQPPMQSPVGT